MAGIPPFRAKNTGRRLPLRRKSGLGFDPLACKRHSLRRKSVSARFQLLAHAHKPLPQFNDFVSLQFRWHWRAFEPIDFGLSDAADQFGAVGNQVSAQVGVAWLALFVDICQVKPQVWPRSRAPIVAGVPLALMVPATTHARQVGIPGADVCVYGRLGFFD